MLARRLALLCVLTVPASANADTTQYSLLDTSLEPPAQIPHLQLPAGHSRQTSWRDQGSAERLRGLVCIEQIFISHPESVWSEDDRARSLASARSAMRYLEAEAGARHIELRFQERISEFDSEQMVASDSDEHSWTRGAVTGAAPRLGMFLPIASCPAQACAQELAILHVASAGRSYALPSLFSGDAEVERVVMFLRVIWPAASLPGQSTAGQKQLMAAERPAGFVHEILHLFGAEDLYQPEARRRAAQRRFPNDVMLQSHRPLSEIEISEYTAYAIGWSDEVPVALAGDAADLSSAHDD